MKHLYRLTMSARAAAAALASCAMLVPALAADTGASGAASGETAQGANSQLEHCVESLGTLGVEEDQHAQWYAQLAQYKLPSTVPVLRMMIQQSNCFVVVERSASGMNEMRQERSLEQSGEMRGGSSFGKGQMVAADYTMRPSIQFSAKGTEGAGGSLFSKVPFGSAIGAIVGGVKTNEASTTLLMIDNRSGVQISAAEGSAKNYDFAMGGALFGSGGGGAAGAYTSTPEGKIIVAAFADSYNQMIKALRSYKAQTVKGGLGTGGRLGVSGGTTEASKAVGK